MSFAFPPKQVQLSCTTSVIVGSKINGTIRVQQSPHPLACVVLSLDATRRSEHRDRNLFHKSLLVRHEDFCHRNHAFEATFSMRIPLNYPVNALADLTHTLTVSVKSAGRRDASDAVNLDVHSEATLRLHAASSLGHTRTSSLPLPPKSPRRRLSMQPMTRLQEEPGPISPVLPASPGSLCDSEWSVSESGATTPRSFEETSSFETMKRHTGDRMSFKARHKKTFSLQSLASLTDGRSSVMARFARKLQFREEEDEELEFSCCGQELLSPAELPAVASTASLPVPVSTHRTTTKAERRLGRAALLDFDFGFDDAPAFEYDEAADRALCGQRARQSALWV